jgi:hypothetical protein
VESAESAEFDAKDVAVAPARPIANHLQSPCSIIISLNVELMRAQHGLAAVVRTWKFASELDLSLVGRNPQREGHSILLHLSSPSVTN